MRDIKPAWHFLLMSILIISLSMTDSWAVAYPSTPSDGVSVAAQLEVCDMGGCWPNMHISPGMPTVFKLKIKISAVQDTQIKISVPYDPDLSLSNIELGDGIIGFWSFGDATHVFTFDGLVEASVDEFTSIGFSIGGGVYDKTYTFIASIIEIVENSENQWEIGPASATIDWPVDNWSLSVPIALSTAFPGENVSYIVEAKNDGYQPSPFSLQVSTSGDVSAVNCDWQGSSAPIGTNIMWWVSDFSNNIPPDKVVTCTITENHSVDGVTDLILYTMNQDTEESDNAGQHFVKIEEPNTTITPSPTDHPTVTPTPIMTSIPTDNYDLYLPFAVR